MDRSKLLYTAIFLFSLLILTGDAYAEEPEITGEAAVLLDLGSGQFLYEKNADKIMYPASTTKALTALLVARNGNLDEVVAMSESAVYAGGSAIWSTPGERFSLEDLLWCILLNSANDATTAAAEHLGGSVEGFAAMMNEEARRLGAQNSHFVNPHGLHDDQHYTTARDLALIGRAALAEPLIRRMAGTQTHQLVREDQEALSLLKNTNNLLWQYDGVIGLKTGYTSKAGQCLIAAAEKDGRTLVSVVLKSENDLIWTDTATLLDYGFDRFQEVDMVIEGDPVCSVPVVYGQSTAHLLAGAGLAHVIPVDRPEAGRWEVRLDRELIAPLRRDEPVGELAVFYAGEEVGQVPLVAGHDVGRLVYTTWWFRSGLGVGVFILFVGLLRFTVRRRRSSLYRGSRIRSL
ncbi:MAG: D-alanyl-D-alanine carboxypeptidase [Candidatus Desulforudis sp.]|nr:D-alanyl-D-alanine carboxypeptidase [Desulforudis sp.]